MIAIGRRSVVGRDAELIVDVEFDRRFVDLTHKYRTIEPTDGDFFGAESTLHRSGAFANELEQALALAFGRFDREGEIDDLEIGVGIEFEPLDELANGDRRGERVVAGAIEFIEQTDLRAEGARAEVGETVAAFSAGAEADGKARRGVKTHRTFVQLQGRRFCHGALDRADGGADLLGLAIGIFVAVGNRERDAHVVGGLDERDGRAVLARTRNGDDAGDGATGEGGGGKKQGGKQDR